MPTLAAPPISAMAPAPAPPGRPSWRALGVLTLLVVVAHVALLDLTPAGLGPEPSPLATKFITRTIVIAPPAAGKPAAPAPAAPAEAAPPAPAKPLRPRAVHPPRPKPKPPPPAATPAPEPVPEALTSSNTEAPDAVAQVAIDSGATPSPETPEATEAPASAPPAGAGAENPPATPAAASGEAPTTLTGTQSLRIPGSVKLEFAATGQRGASPMQGVFGNLVWLQDGSSYDAQLTLKLLFRTVVDQHSSGRIGPSGIEPARYSENRRGELAAHFVRDQGQIVFSNNAPSVPLLPGAQDRLSVVMQLGGLLAGDPGRYPAGSQIALQTAGTREAGVWVFNIEGEEKMTVPAGEYSVRKLTRSPRKEFDVKLEVWFAPDLGWLPVRIRQTQPNGDFADMELRESLPAGPGS